VGQFVTEHLPPDDPADAPPDDPADRA